MQSGAAKRDRNLKERAVALIHPTDNVGKETTKHPRVCLAAGFAVIIGAALLVHLVFSALT